MKFVLYLYFANLIENAVSILFKKRKSDSFCFCQLLLDEQNPMTLNHTLCCETLTLGQEIMVQGLNQ